MGTQIITKELYIKKLINVIRSQNKNCNKLISVNSRHSDAFVYILEGECTYTFSDNIPMRAKKGDILYLAKDSYYTMYIHTQTYKYIFCDFEFDGNDYKSAVFTPKNSSAAESLFIKIYKYHTASCEELFAETMAAIYEIYGMIRSINSSLYTDLSIRKRLISAEKYIHTNIANPNLSVAMLADSSEMSEVYFRRLFKSRYGVSPSRYITITRLNRARELMRYDFLSLEECAVQSGFSTLQYLCRVFKKEFGISPARYREKEKQF